MIAGNIDGIPPVTALTEIDISTNPAVLQKLGLSSGSSESGNTVAVTE
jgi:hypothetical protein